MDNRETAERDSKGSGGLIKSRQTLLMLMFVVAQPWLLVIIFYGDFYPTDALRGPEARAAQAKWICAYLLVLAAGMISAAHLRKYGLVALQLIPIITWLMMIPFAL